MVLTNWGADKIRSSKTGVNPFHATGLFLYHLKTSKTFILMSMRWITESADGPLLLCFEKF